LFIKDDRQFLQDVQLYQKFYYLFTYLFIYLNEFIYLFQFRYSFEVLAIDDGRPYSSSRFQFRLTLVKNEEQLLTEFMKRIQILDPDMLVGFDVQQFSLGYLIDRSNLQYGFSFFFLFFFFLNTFF